MIRDLREECRTLKQFKQDEVQSRRLVVSENRKLETRLQTLKTRLECSICRHNQIDCVTFCGHAFCQDCLRSWYQEGACPTCRELMKDDTRLIAQKLFVWSGRDFSRLHRGLNLTLLRSTPKRMKSTYSYRLSGGYWIIVVWRKHWLKLPKPSRALLFEPFGLGAIDKRLLERGSLSV